jgi:chromosome segregation ATPase
MGDTTAKYFAANIIEINKEIADAEAQLVGAQESVDLLTTQIDLLKKEKQDLIDEISDEDLTLAVDKLPNSDALSANIDMSKRTIIAKPTPPIILKN